MLTISFRITFQHLFYPFNFCPKGDSAKWSASIHSDLTWSNTKSCVWVLRCSWSWFTSQLLVFFPGSFYCLWRIIPIPQPPVRKKGLCVPLLIQIKFVTEAWKKKARKFFRNTLIDLWQKECVAHYRETVRRRKAELGLSGPLVEGTSLYLCLCGKQEGPLKAAKYSVGISVLAAREWYTSVPVASSSVLFHACTTPVLISAHTCPY